MSDYYIADAYISGARIAINRERFDDLSLCRSTLLILTDIEEIYAVLCQSFVDFEECLFTCALHYAYQESNPADYDEIFERTRNLVNVKLLSFLTASRTYNEQVRSRLLELSRLHEKSFDPGREFSHEFDTNLTYRVMDALRNHALHHRLPLGAISFSASSLRANPQETVATPSRLRRTINPKIKVDELVKNDKLRNSTRNELKNIGSKFINAKYLVRGFISSLARCHHTFREWTQDIYEITHNKSIMAKNELGKASKDNVESISVIEISEEAVINEHYIDPAFSFSLLRARSAWSGIRFAKRVYISTEVLKENETYPDRDDDLWIVK